MIILVQLVFDKRDWCFSAAACHHTVGPRLNCLNLQTTNIGHRSLIAFFRIVPIGIRCVKLCIQPTDLSQRTHWGHWYKRPNIVSGDFAPTRSLWSKISGEGVAPPHQSFLHG